MRRFGPIGPVVLALVVSAAPAATAAEPVFLRLKIQGAEVKGDVTLKGVEGMIECLSYEQEVASPIGPTGTATGRHQYQPIKITKRIDQASPQLIKALSQNAVVEAEFHFYRVMQTGQVQQFYTVEIKQARVVSIKQTNPDRLVPATANLPPLEEVSFAFATIKWTHAQGGSHEDSVAGAAIR